MTVAKAATIMKCQEKLKQERSTVIPLLASGYYTGPSADNARKKARALDQLKTLAMRVMRAETYANTIGYIEDRKTFEVAFAELTGLEKEYKKRLKAF